MDTLQALACPCGDHIWPDKTRGKRSCPQCSTSVVCTKAGVKVLLLPAERAIIGKGPTEEQRLFSVWRQDGTILCSGCGQRTDTLHSIDGRIDSDIQSLTRVQVETGEVSRFNPLSGTFQRHPHYETRYVPKHVRGILCHSCAAVPGAKKIDAPGRKALVWKLRAFNHHNSKIQRLAAQKVEDYIAYCLLTKSLPSVEMLWNIEASIIHPETGEKQIAQAGWSGARWTFHNGKLIIGGDSTWLGSQGIRSVTERADGSLQVEAHAASHPRLCPCLDCLRKEVLKPFAPVAILDRHILRVPLPMPPMPVGLALQGYQRPLAVNSPVIGIGRLALAIANGLTGVERSGVHASRRCDDYERTLPRASAPKADPPMVRHFASRPLPQRAIALRPV